MYDLRSDCAGWTDARAACTSKDGHLRTSVKAYFFLDPRVLRLQKILTLNADVHTAELKIKYSLTEHMQIAHSLLLVAYYTVRLVSRELMRVRMLSVPGLISCT